jgi:hypothetical protein
LAQNVHPALWMTTQRATGRTQVTSYQATPYDEVEQAPSLLEIRIAERFTGDIAGEGTGRVIQVVRGDGSATFVGIERVHGSLGGRSGSFVLQVQGTVAGKQMKAEWVVVPRSGSEELRGLRGEGGFEAQLGDHGSIWLDYAFDRS